jgi:phosphoribosylformylglycinamidine cyclo-ligase
VAIGFAGYGQATYESAYNSGIGSNGLTGARHDLLDHAYAKTYPETFDPNTEDQYVYQGPAKLTDTLAIGSGTEERIGKLLLSPTRTFLPLLHRLVGELSGHISGIVHNTGGGQSKATKFLRGLRLVKDNLLPVPPLFKYIDKVNDMTPHELYQVYNMGTRLEVYLPPAAADDAIAIAKSLNIDAQVIGHITEGESGVALTTEDQQNLWYPAA